MNINASEVPKGMDYQYGTISVCGDRSLGDVDKLKATGWRPVPASRHPALAKRSASGTTIEIGGLLLMERPKVLTAGAIAWEADKARAQLKAGTTVHVKRTLTLWERFTKVRWSAWFACRTYMRRVIVRAAPTCTFWRWNPNTDGLHFAFRPSWAITYRELSEVTGASHV